MSTTTLEPQDISILPDNDFITPDDEERLEPLAPKYWPSVDHLVTEDDTPVDNLPSAKQQRLLVESLYNAWTPPKDSQTFLADANIAIYYAVGKPPIVPDVFLSLNVQVANDWWNKLHRSYFVWMFGKLPDIVIEIVSNQEGQEADRKFHTYARLRVPYYVIFDPQQQLSNEVLRLYELQGLGYMEMDTKWLSAVGIGLILWDGVYENKKDRWLRWCDSDGNLVLTGRERAEQEYQRAEQEHQRAEQERQRAERLAKKLQALGIDPDSVR